MNYRQPHHLRVVTLSSRESRGTVLYPPEFAHLAASPDPGAATEPHRSVARETTDHPAPDSGPVLPAPWDWKRRVGTVSVLLSACVMCGAYGWSLACLTANDYAGAKVSSLIGVGACLAIAAVWGRGR